MLHAQPSALEVRLYGVIPSIFVMVGDGDNVPQDPRIVVGTVKAAVNFNNFVDQRLDIAGFGDIGSNKARLTARLADVLQRPLAAFRIDIGDDDLCPFPGKELRRRTADARASAGNKRRFGASSRVYESTTWAKINR